MTNKKLQNLANVWIKRLELEAPVWRDISVSFGTEKELEGCLGYCTWDIDNSCAIIKIAKEPVQAENDVTVEEVLIHELLHLRLEGHRDIKDKRDAQYERALNTISRVLCQVK